MTTYALNTRADKDNDYSQVGTFDTLEAAMQAAQDITATKVVRYGLDEEWHRGDWGSGGVSWLNHYVDTQGRMYLWRIDEQP